MEKTPAGRALVAASAVLLVHGILAGTAGGATLGFLFLCLVAHARRRVAGSLEAASVHAERSLETADDPGRIHVDVEVTGSWPGLDLRVTDDVPGEVTVEGPVTLEGDAATRRLRYTCRLDDPGVRWREVEVELRGPLGLWTHVEAVPAPGEAPLEDLAEVASSPSGAAPSGALDTALEALLEEPVSGAGDAATPTRLIVVLDRPRDRRTAARLQALTREAARRARAVGAEVRRLLVDGDRVLDETPVEAEQAVPAPVGLDRPAAVPASAPDADGWTSGERPFVTAVAGRVPASPGPGLRDRLEGQDPGEVAVLVASDLARRPGDLAEALAGEARRGAPVAVAVVPPAEPLARGRVPIQALEEAYRRRRARRRALEAVEAAGGAVVEVPGPADQGGEAP